jgi:hypothetical protein
MKRIAAFQFANCYARRKQGYQLVGRAFASPHFCWLDPVNENGNRNVGPTLLEGYIWGRRPAAFHVGLPDGEYRVRLCCYRKDREHGPFCIKANGEFVLRDVSGPAGGIRRWSFACRAQGGKLALEFIPHLGREFAVNSLEIFARREVKTIPLFKTRLLTAVPSRAELMKRVADDPRTTLRRVCDRLVARCAADGYLGDVWVDGGRYSYTQAMPIRALLAGYDLLGDRSYLAAATRALNAFVDEQLPNGAWDCVFHGQPVSRWSSARLSRLLKEGRLPMSDIGSVVAALAVGSHYAPPATRMRYLRAVRKFCDEWAAKFQLKSGGFTDGQWHGYEGKIYSCATAIQAGVHSLAYRMTGVKAYQRAAQRALEFLLKDWRPDGRMLGRAPHWYVRNGKPFVLEPLHFGDQWYYDEGFITTWHHAPEGEFRRRVQHALDNRVHGSAGLLAALHGQVWWPLQDIWNNAKSIGIVQTLQFAQQFGTSTPRLGSALRDTSRFLRTPACAARLGIMAEDAERPGNLHGLTTWSGMANEATGFAGMTLAEGLRPGILYLAGRR